MNEPKFVACDVEDAVDGDVMIFRAADGTLPARVVPSSQVPPATSTRTVTASETVQPSDRVLFVNAASGPVTITLRSAASGASVAVKKIDSSGNAVTVQRAASDTVDGGTSKVLGAQWESYLFVPNGVSMWGIF